jgi:hypothetical protein
VVVYRADADYSLPWPKERCTKNAADEESSNADPFLIGERPRGALRTKNLLETSALFNKKLESRQYRKEYRKPLADIYKNPDLRYNDLEDHEGDGDGDRCFELLGAFGSMIR